ncbi:hypothetical protein CPB97_002044, partial [Podila verticillata]
MGPKAKRKSGKQKSLASLKAQVAASNTTTGSASNTSLTASTTSNNNNNDNSNSGASTPTVSTPTMSAPASPAPVASLSAGTAAGVSSPLSHPSSVVNHVAIPVDSNEPLTEEQKRQLHDQDREEEEQERAHEHQQHHQYQDDDEDEDQDNNNNNNNNNSASKPLLSNDSHTKKAHFHSHLSSSSPPTYSTLSPNGNAPHTNNTATHAPRSPQQLAVDRHSIIHTMPTSTTPLKQSLGPKYGSQANGDHDHSGHDHNHDHASHSHDHSSSSALVPVHQHYPHDPNSPPLRGSTPPPIACKGVLITNESTKNKRKLIFVTVLCLCFFTVEMVGGYFAKSLALMSDAFHLLS